MPGERETGWWVALQPHRAQSLDHPPPVAPTGPALQTFIGLQDCSSYVLSWMGYMPMVLVRSCMVASGRRRRRGSTGSACRRRQSACPPLPRLPFLAPGVHLHRAGERVSDDPARAQGLWNRAGLAPGVCMDRSRGAAAARRARVHAGGGGGGASQRVAPRRAAALGGAAEPGADPLLGGEALAERAGCAGCGAFPSLHGRDSG